MNLELGVPDELVERIAHRAAELVAEHQVANASPWLDTKGAAEYMACPVSRVHDLVQLRKLEPHRDGRRLLFRPDELDVYLENDA